MKKKETVLSVLKSIKKDTDALRTAVALLLSSNELMKSISEQKDTEYFTITDTPNKKTSEILQEMKNKFPVWSYYSDTELDAQFPAPKEQMTRKFLKSIEPDEDLLGKSTRECDAMGVQGITLRERLLMELSYFSETGKHLDVKEVTFCSGSRDSDGYVPGVGLYNFGEVRVNWYCLDLSYSKVGVRRAIS